MPRRSYVEVFFAIFGSFLVIYIVFPIAFILIRQLAYPEM
ncbi:molybdenum ABC transporter permease, partial [Archaeoglobales archaeon]